MGYEKKCLKKLTGHQYVNSHPFIRLSTDITMNAEIIGLQAYFQSKSFLKFNLIRKSDANVDIVVVQHTFLLSSVL